ncbi:MAG: patatin-like phospholipase family protein [Negativicutes bacterium]|jgi:hypothetical protein
MFGKKRFRILSIDGGGVRGCFPAAFLARLEQLLGNNTNIGGYFDLCVGTSAGAVIALALGAGLNAHEIFVEYEAACRNIFGSSKIIGRLLTARQKQAKMLTAFTEVLGDRRLSDSKVNLLLTSYDLIEQRPALYKTPFTENIDGYSDVRMVDVAMGAAAVPVILPAYDSPDGRKLVDGVVVANDPTVLGIIEAINRYRIKPEDIDVLSIGCLFDEYDFHKNIDGWAEWLPLLPFVLIRAQETTTQVIALQLLGNNRKNLFRFNPAVPPLKYDYDDITIVPELRRLAAQEADKAFLELKSVFLKNKIVGRSRK